MAASDKFSLAILFKVVDKASGPLRRVGRKFTAVKKPVTKLGLALHRLSSSPNALSLFWRETFFVSRHFVCTLTLFWP